MTVSPSTPDSHPTGNEDACVLALLAAVIASDFLLLAAGLLLGLNAWLLLLAHFALVAFAAHELMSLRTSDYTHGAVGLLLLLMGGPLAGLGVLVISMAERRGRLEKDVLEEWYAWLSGGLRPEPTLLLQEAILAGREFKPAAGGGRRFADTMCDGTLAEKQMLLGHIGLKFHRDYLPLLEMALHSPQAGVRAQAAAVFVKLKERFRRQLHDELAATDRLLSGEDNVAMLTSVRALLECVDSSFLDPGDAKEALARAEMLCRFAEARGAPADETERMACRIIAAGGGDTSLLDRLMARVPQPSADLLAELARSLVATGRHRDLHHVLATCRLRTGSNPCAGMPSVASLLAPAGGRR